MKKKKKFASDKRLNEATDPKPEPAVNVIVSSRSQRTRNVAVPELRPISLTTATVKETI